MNTFTDCSVTINNTLEDLKESLKIFKDIIYLIDQNQKLIDKVLNKLDKESFKILEY